LQPSPTTVKAVSQWLAEDKQVRGGAGAPYRKKC
jgi:hypothetical protein